MLYLDKPFWREEPFNDDEILLLEALFRAHHNSTFRNSVSTVTAMNAASGSGELSNAIAASILTIGSLHAPLELTTTFLSARDPLSTLGLILEQGSKVPGWGGTFQREAPDPIWQEVDDMLASYPVASTISAVTMRLHQLGKRIYPNPSAYTAATAIIIGLPATLTPFLFIAARLSAWTQLSGRMLLPQKTNQNNEAT